jgi:hypothetical protein
MALGSELSPDMPWACHSSTVAPMAMLGEIARYNSHPMQVVQTCDACGAALYGHRVEGMAEVSLRQCERRLVITSPRPPPDELGQSLHTLFLSIPTRFNPTPVNCRRHGIGFWHRQFRSCSVTGRAVTVIEPESQATASSIRQSKNPHPYR